MCVCLSVCSLWHTWLAECAHSGGARDFRCMLPQDTERYEYSMRSQKNCCTWAKQRTQKRRTSNTAAKVHTTFNNNNQQQQQQQLQFNYVLCFVRCFVVDLCMSVSLCTVWSKHWFTRRTYGRQSDVHFSTTLRHCACAQHVNWECAALCACVSLVCASVCVCGFNCCDYYIYRNVRTGTSSYSNKLND